MKNTKMLKNEKGFTLIEIIAVIIILGILAAVAIPKFFSMQDQAKQAAIDGALSEAAARFNQAYSQYILTNKTAPAQVSDLYTLLGGATAGTTGVSIGDFTVTWTEDASNNVVITILSANTIPDLTGLTVTKTLGDVTWG